MRTLLICLLVLMTSCGSNQIKVDISEFEKKIFVDGETTMPYRILLPKDYDREKAYPLVMVLHGAGERGTDNEAQMKYGPEVFLKPENRERFPAIVVFPQCSEESYWSNVGRERKLMFFNFTFKPDGDPTQAMGALQNLLVKLTTDYKVAKNKVYVGGLSMGGMGTFEIVRRNPNTFAAAFSICGGAHPDTAPQIKDTKWWVFHGDADMVVDYEHSQKMVEALKAQGADVKFTTYEDVNHNSWENAFAEPDLLPWLFSHSLE